MAKFLYKKQQLIKNFDKLNQSFLFQKINFNIFYSVKTNSSDSVLKSINKLCYFEIVSEDEWKLIKKFKPKELVLNGPSKSIKLVKDIINSGVKNLYFNIDNDTDVEIINKLNKSYLKYIKIGLRVYLNKNNIWNRFGFDIDSEITKNIVRSLGSKLAGFHFHFSTNNFDVNNYSEIFKKIEIIIKTYGIKLHYIDIGGGLPGANESFMFNKMYEELPKVINKFSKVNDNKIQVISEVGRNLVQNVFDLETNVVSIKKNDTNIIDVVIDTNIMHFPCFWEKKYGIEYFSQNKEKNPNLVNIFGNSCMQIDKISENQLIMCSPKVGDKVLITNVGAYSLSQASNFISKIPKIEES